MIYLLRHGETIWNKQGRRQGWKDSPLTKKGCSQATANGVRLRKLLANGDAVKMYSSPQGRAWQTAVLVAEEINYPVNDILLENSLREISFGDWEGMTEPEVADLFPREWAKRNSDTWNNRPNWAKLQLLFAMGKRQKCSEVFMLACNLMRSPH